MNMPPVPNWTGESMLPRVDQVCAEGRSTDSVSRTLAFGGDRRGPPLGGGLMLWYRRYQRLPQVEAADRIRTDV